MAQGRFDDAEGVLQEALDKVDTPALRHHHHHCHHKGAPRGSRSCNHTTTTVYGPFSQDHPGEPVPEENF